MSSFPRGFLWGTSTSSYQIEGAAKEGGRGESIWDVFSHTPGRVANNENGDTACDHYHLWKQDVALMKELGYKAYRFSIAWPRIFPAGRGRINEEAVDFYSRLVDDLLDAGITPMITLYHWDLPSALPGGWLNRDTALAFADYSAAVVKALGDRVKLWTTLNEPWCSSFLSYFLGEHAPGEKNLAHALQAAHHLLLAHGMAVPAIRAAGREAEVNIVLNLSPVYPYTRSAGDLFAARELDGTFNRWFLDPIFGRRYPADLTAELQQIGALAAEPDYIQPGDMQTIAAPLDALGINYYDSSTVRAIPGREMQPAQWEVVKDPDTEKTDMNWEIHPQGLYDLLLRVNWDYQPGRIYVTENGASYSDGPDAAGKIHDERRTAYLRSHIRAVERAVQAGAPVQGYFVWSFMDNFEWAFGYRQRFGLVYVDYPTQKRLPKDSAFFYSQVCRQNGLD